MWDIHSGIYTLHDGSIFVIHSRTYLLRQTNYHPTPLAISRTLLGRNPLFLDRDTSITITRRLLCHKLYRWCTYTIEHIRYSWQISYCQKEMLASDTIDTWQMLNRQLRHPLPQLDRCKRIHCGNNVVTKTYPHCF